MNNPTQSLSDDLVKTLDTIGLDTGIDGVKTFDTETLAAFIESQKAQWEREAREDENAKWKVVAEEIVEKDGVYRAVNYLNQRCIELTPPKKGNK